MRESRVISGLSNTTTPWTAQAADALSAVSAPYTTDPGPTMEFVGTSGKTIAEAVRNALASASQSLTTLDGLGILVIPQLYRHNPTPRFRVTLRISMNGAAHETQPRIQQTASSR